MKQRALKISIITVISIFLYMGVYKQLKNLSRIKGVSTNVSSSEIIALTNLVRLNQDISTLKPNIFLEKAAKSKADDMIEKKYFDHVDQDGNGPWKFIDSSEYIYQHAGENLARNFYSAEDVISAWFDSEEHKNNMLNPLFNDIGVAVVEDKDDLYIVQLLASQIPADLLDQIDKYQKDFTFATPISGKRNSVNPNIALMLFSLFITLSTISITIVIVGLIKNQTSPFKSPKVHHWKRK